MKIKFVYLIIALVPAFCWASDLLVGETSDNFINRWGFQEMCDHVFDTRTGIQDQATTTEPGGVTFNPADVKPGDLIFVRKIDLFMATMHDQIPYPYIMVTHGDFLDTCKDSDIDYLDSEKIIAWFAIHPTKRAHPKYHPIPLGVLQKRTIWDERFCYNQLFKELRAKPKSKLMSVTFDDDRNPERAEVLNIFRRKNLCFIPDKLGPFLDYLEEMASSKFTPSPRGWGPDCYRTWEALLVGSIPIVKRGQCDVMEIARSLLRSCPCYDAQLDRLFEDLPILVIDDWEEITEEFLNKKYEEITSKTYDLRMLYMEFWHEKILAVQKSYLDAYYESAKGSDEQQ